jgi:prepilin-type N-terminal cleavage/methylation domain-containing protein
MRRIVRDHRSKRVGFTLVELLIVIAILGILVSLLAWGVNAARIAILKKAQTAEIQNIANAIENYRAKYGDYPPDGSSWPIVEAHLRKAFPNILITELNMLNPANVVNNAYVRNDNDLTGTHPLGGRVFDPAEALVFFLGGFSNDPQKPLTGPGGPFAANPDVAGTYMYNTQRENGFFEFKTGRLTLSADGRTSTDETLYGELVANDLMPVYVGNGPSIAQGGVPITYFDSRTYQVGTSYFNFHIPGAVASSPNCVRPFLSNEVNNSVAGSPKPLRYANDKTFQLMNAGYDKLYGCQSVASVLASNPRTLFLFNTPGGNACQLNATTLLFYAPTSPSPIRYYLNEFVNLRPVDDNISNFIDGPTFAESL